MPDDGAALPAGRSLAITDEDDDDEDEDLEDDDLEDDDLEDDASVDEPLLLDDWVRRAILTTELRPEALSVLARPQRFAMDGTEVGEVLRHYLTLLAPDVVTSAEVRGQLEEAYCHGFRVAEVVLNVPLAALIDDTSVPSSGTAPGTAMLLLQQNAVALQRWFPPVLRAWARDLPARAQRVIPSASYTLRAAYQLTALAGFTFATWRAEPPTTQPADVERGDEVPAGAAPGSAGGDVVAQLRSLVEMHDAGLLSEAEFSAAKARLLQA